MIVSEEDLISLKRNLNFWLRVLIKSFFAILNGTNSNIFLAKFSIQYTLNNNLSSEYLTNFDSNK